MPSKLFYSHSRADLIVKPKSFRVSVYLNKVSTYISIDLLSCLNSILTFDIANIQTLFSFNTVSLEKETLLLYICLL